ncbi:hypothetical protein H257_09870 [Aphanomyces astaci]|uniref:Uncharacterized protein n=1 Tax=Aphanomyces astaci TaxID=112090 RepID=W4GA19_APHAT|nr:hypothetical protein H257_09870 [Aphanomyces astaci]ETV75909.1 hypothetical protein H257_09870 [Aphanomyces astaci]|eukprot:XP_009834551.1 hypothetical protein H257_09870 [Aphanomyces astaci]
MPSQLPQTKGVLGSAWKGIQQEGGIQERPEDKLQTEATMLPLSDARHGTGAQSRPVHIPEDCTVSTAGDDSRRQTDVSEDKEEKRIYTVPCNEAKSIKTIGETSGSTDVYTGPSAGDNSRRQTDGSEAKEEKGMYAEPSKEESSCRQTEPNTRDASASPDGDSLEPRGSASVLSRILPRVQGPLTTFPEETSDAEEPRAPSRDSTNPVLVQTQFWRVRGGGTMSAVTVGSTRTEYWKQKDPRLDSDITPVFTAAQIDAISRCDMAGLPDSRHVDIEERLYPIWLVGAAGAIEPAPDERAVWAGELPEEAFSISLGGVGTPWIVSSFPFCG